MGGVLRTFLPFIFLLQAGFVFGQTPDFNVGLRSVSAPFQGEAGQIKMLVWYPTMQKAQKTKLGPFELRVAPGAKPVQGKHGLIVISHGNGGSHIAHRGTAMYLASEGFFVVSVLHPHNNFSDNSDARTNRNWINRPKHIKAALDFILGNEELRQYIDPQRIGIIGHSAGGYTALAAVGGVPDTARISAHCEKHGKEDPVFCGYSGIASALLGLFSDPSPNGEEAIQNTRDPRIRAAVLMAPMGVLFHDPRSLSRVKVPILLYRAEKDRVLCYPFHAESIHKNLASAHEYIVVQNAGHFSFMAPYPEPMKQKRGKVAKDPEGFDRAEFHRNLNPKIAGFFSRSLQAQ